VSEKTTADKAAVIRQLKAAEETSQERLVKKHVPAWVVSGAVHVGVIALAILFFGGRNTSATPTDKIVNTTAEKTDEPEEKNLTNDDPGLDSNIASAIPEITRLDEKTVDSVVTQDLVGQPNVETTDTTGLAIPGVGSTDFTTPGVTGSEGAFKAGDGGNNGMIAATLAGRSGATKSQLLKSGGGNEASERAVALGLAWLAKQQYWNKDNAKDPLNGSWKYDAGRTEERAAATGMALLPFLAAGVTHKKPKNKDVDQKNYEVVVERGLNYLMRNCPLSGGNAGRMSADMYAQAIATLPLCEAYGMTKDSALRPYAQAAINFIQKAQGPNGSWGYSPGSNGDTSIVGWQIQAIKAAQLSKDIVVDDRVLTKAIGFLNLAAGGSKKSMYGYGDNAGAAPGTPLTAVGLLCRYYIDKWGPVHPGMIDGVGGLVKNPPAGSGPVRNMYYYYYATQVVHFYEGEDWKTWNEGAKQADGTRKGGMRDWLVGAQVKGAGVNAGSWEPEAGWFGSSCGRLGTTAMCLLTLEVYYRHLPLYKRGADGKAIQIIE
jgi:hypothetical protein